MNLLKISPAQALASAPPAMLIAMAVGLLALPSAVLAFSSRLDGKLALDQTAGNLLATQGKSTFASGLAAQVSGLFRFTPAGMVMQPDRAVTVAVRVDDQTVRAITVIGSVTPKSLTKLAMAGQPPSLRIAPSAYNLGVSHNTDGLGQKLAITADGNRVELPDLAKMPESYTGSDPSARLAIVDRDKARNADSKPSLNLGSSYNLGNNLKLTAGVRYSQDKERLLPRSDGKKDSQGVFVGTQIKF